MKTQKMLSVLMLSSACFFSGCVVNQKIPYSYSPEAVGQTKITSAVESSVKDERPFVLNGDKTGSYVGHFRGGYGNTWNVNTKDNVPLADQFKQDLQKELESLGVDPKNTGSKKTLNVIIEDYNFDAYINGRFWYKFKVAVVDANQTVLAEDTIQGNREIKGSFWVGAVFAFKRELPKIHGEIIRSLVRDNEKIMRALTAA